MNRIIVYRLLKSNLLVYRHLPISFEYSWKVGDIITDESGQNKCEIISIEDEKDIDFQSIKKHNSNLMPKHLYKNRESFKKKLELCIVLLNTIRL